MALRVKICGLMHPDELAAAVAGGAALAGFDCRAGSPRFISPEQAALLSNKTPTTVTTIGVFADPRPADIDRRTAAGADFDLLQLTGNESPRALQILQGATGLPAIKLISLAALPPDADVAAILRPYEKICEAVALETAPGSAPRLAGLRFAKPWFLAGRAEDTPALAALCAALRPPGVSLALDTPAADPAAGVRAITGFFDTLRRVMAA